MPGTAMALRFIAQEAAALETRLSAVPRFSATIPMVTEARPSGSALELADRAVGRSKRLLHREVRTFRGDLHRRPPTRAAVRSALRGYLILHRRFQALLATVDIFADALTQRAEHGTGKLLGWSLRAGERRTANRSPLRWCPPGRARPRPGGRRRGPAGVYSASRGVSAMRSRWSGSRASVCAASALRRSCMKWVIKERRCCACRKSIGKSSPMLGAPGFWKLAWRVGGHRRWRGAGRRVGMRKTRSSATLGLFSVVGRGARVTFHEEPNDPHPMPWVRAHLSAAFGSYAMPHPTGASWQTSGTPFIRSIAPHWPYGVSSNA